MNLLKIKMKKTKKIEVNGYSVLLTFKNEVRELTKEEIEEVAMDTFNSTYSNSLTPELKWKAIAFYDKKPFKLINKLHHQLGTYNKVLQKLTTLLGEATAETDIKLYKESLDVINNILHK